MDAKLAGLTKTADRYAELVAAIEDIITDLNATSNGTLVYRIARPNGDYANEFARGRDGCLDPESDAKDWLATMPPSWARQYSVVPVRLHSAVDIERLAIANRLRDILRRPTCAC